MLSYLRVILSSKTMPQKTAVLEVKQKELLAEIGVYHVPTEDFVEIVLLIALCYVVLGHSEVGEKLQRVAVVVKLSIETLFIKTVDKFLNCLKLTVKFSCLLNY